MSKLSDVLNRFQTVGMFVDDYTCAMTELWCDLAETSKDKKSRRECEERRRRCREEREPKLRKCGRQYDENYEDYEDEYDELDGIDREAIKRWRKPLPPQKGGIHGGKKGKKGYDRKREKRRSWDDE